MTREACNNDLFVLEVAAIKLLLFILLHIVHFLIYTLILGALFGLHLSYYADYRIDASGLESAVKQVWPSAEISNQWDLNGSKLFVFKDDSVYRCMFFPKAIFRDKYALNDISILSSYKLFNDPENIQVNLTDFRGTYHVMISADEMAVIDFDRTKNLTGFPPVIQIIIIIIFYSVYTYGVARRYRRFKENKRWLI